LEGIQQFQTCLVCGQERPEGIRLLEKYLCLSCEQEMAVLDVSDLRYNYIVWRLRSLWVDEQGTRLA
jgi:hypothetical protein